MVQPRVPIPTVTFVDQYCSAYQHLFPEVRSYECFKFLHLGMIVEIPRKSLRAIAQIIGLPNEQSLHHFLTESPWEIKELRHQRIAIILQVLQGRSFTLIIDDTGDKKKGQTTDYVARQYIGNLGKIEQGIVSVNAYGYLKGMTFPLMFKVYKPQKTLKKGDSYKTKTQLAAEIIQELQELGLKFELVLADSFYGESSTFISVLNKLKLEYVVAIRSNHGVWMPAGQQVRTNKWKEFDRIFSNSKIEIRYIREIIYGQRQTVRYWQITTDTEKLPDQSTWFIMSNIPGNIQKEVGNKYGFRTWVEYTNVEC